MKKIVYVCDIHADDCPQPDTVAPEILYDVFSGERYETDICDTERQRRKEENARLRENSRRPEGEAAVPAKKAKRKPKSSEEGGDWRPLVHAVALWHRSQGLPAPRGRFSRDRDSTVAFLASPEGRQWSGWKPGMPIPTLNESGRKKK